MRRALTDPGKKECTPMQKPKNFLAVILSFLKLGTIAFGGGAALIPAIEKELVENKKWIKKERFDISVAVASISPAALSVAICTVWSRRYSVLSTYVYALPGTLILLTLLTGFSLIGEVGTRYLSFASVGLISFVLFLLYRFIIKNYRHGAAAGIKAQYLAIMAAAFILTGGSALGRLVYMLFGVQLMTPVFSINIITLMLVTFFVICFVGASKSKVKLIFALLVAVLFSLANGRAGILSQWMLPLVVVMVVMVASSIIYDVVTKKGAAEKHKPKFDYKPLRNLLIFLLIAAVLTALVFAVSGDVSVWDYAFRVITSTLSTFGGGEVYIGVSEDVFVRTGFIPEQIFNTQIIAVALTMPGPFIVAVVSGIGFTYGSIHHGMGLGWMFGLLGLSLTITATALGALILSIFFEFLKNSERLQMVLRYIMPVVCGMLVSTALSLLRQASSVLVSVSVNPFLSVGIVLGISAFMLFLHRKYKLGDIALLLLGAVGAITALGIFLY